MSDNEQDISEDEFKDEFKAEFKEETSSNEYLKPEKYEEVEEWIEDCRDSTEENYQIDHKIPRIKEEIPDFTHHAENSMNHRYNFNCTNVKMEQPAIPALLSLPYIPPPQLRFIPFFHLCKQYLKSVDCTEPNCNFEHELPIKWKVNFQNLPTDILMKNYCFYRDAKTEEIYKLIFPVVAEHLSIKKDFNNITMLVTDVLEITLNTDKAPFINHVINALLKTGFTFSSTVEFVFMSVSVELCLSNLLCDILLTLTVDKKNYDEHWGVIVMLSKHKNYDVDNGIIKCIMTNVLKEKSVQKEFLFKLYHDLIKLIPNRCLKYISSAVLPEFIELLRKQNLFTESEEFQSRCVDLRVIDIRILPLIESIHSSPASRTNSSTPISAEIINSKGQSPQDVIFVPNIVIPPPKKGLPLYPKPPAQPHQSTAQPNYPTSTFRHPRQLQPQSWINPAPYIPQNFSPNIRCKNPYAANVSQPAERAPNYYSRPALVSNIYHSEYQNVKQQPSASNVGDDEQQQPVYIDQISAVVPKSQREKIYTAIAEENFSDILALIMNFKDHQHIDYFLKIFIIDLFQTTHNYPTFFNTICERAGMFSFYI